MRGRAAGRPARHLGPYPIHTPHLLRPRPLLRLGAATRARLESVEELLRLGADRSIRRRKDNATAAEKVRELLERARYVSPLHGPDEAELAKARKLEAILDLLERS